MSYLLSKNILATVTYYDVLNMPLSAFEIWRHLIRYDTEAPEQVSSCSLMDVYTCLTAGNLDANIDEQQGFYFLRGRQHLIAPRIRAEKISVSKLKRLRHLAALLIYLPYVRMLGITGSLAMKNSTSASDWDIFVVLRSGKIWTGRTLLTGLLHCIGKRRYGHKIQNRVCLNYFVTDDNLEISTKDLFSAHEYRFLVPLLYFTMFQIFELKNRWIRTYHPNFILTTLPSRWTFKDTALTQSLRKLLERVCDLVNVEQWLARWQKEKIERNPKTYVEGSLVEANDHTLVFLPHPRGPHIFEKFKERLSV